MARPATNTTGRSSDSHFASRITKTVRSNEGLAYSVNSRIEGGTYYPEPWRLVFQSKVRSVAYATELAMTGDPMSAEEAHRLGLVAAVVAPDQLMAVALERARRLAEGPRQTYALIKRGMERALELDLEQTMELESQLQAMAAGTSDAREAIRAFIEKRKPVFGGPLRG